MLIIHHIPPNKSECWETPEMYVQYTVPEDFDLLQGIHDATLDFCLDMYQEGYGLGNLTYGEFAQLVPDKYCKQYGFSKTIINDVAKEQNPATICVNACELTRIMKERDAVTEKTNAIWEAANALAKRLDVSAKRSNSYFVEWTFEQKMAQVLAWTTEYINSDEANISRFYQKKIRRMIKQQQ